jgi:hypothetical protein
MDDKIEIADMEEFSDEELLKELKELNGVGEKRGGFRKGSGRPKKNGEKREAKEKVKLKPLPRKSPRLEEDERSLLGVSPAKGGKGFPTKKEVFADVAEQLRGMGFDPVANMVNMFSEPEKYGLEGKDLIKINSELMSYQHGKKKSIEKKEEKSWKIEVIRKDFRLEGGEVIEV